MRQTSPEIKTFRNLGALKIMTTAINTITASETEARQVYSIAFDPEGHDYSELAPDAEDPDYTGWNDVAILAIDAALVAAGFPTIFMSDVWEEFDAGSRFHGTKEECDAIKAILESLDFEIEIYEESLPDFGQTGYDEFNENAEENVGLEGIDPFDYCDTPQLSEKGKEAARKAYNDGWSRADTERAEFDSTRESVLADQLENAIDGPLRGESSTVVRHKVTGEEYSVTVGYYPAIDFGYLEIAASVESDLADFLKRDDLADNQRAAAQSNLAALQKAESDWRAKNYAPKVGA
jgi:hypothetical protein